MPSTLKGHALWFDILLLYTSLLPPPLSGSQVLSAGCALYRSCRCAALLVRIHGFKLLLSTFQW